MALLSPATLLAQAPPGTPDATPQALDEDHPDLVKKKDDSPKELTTRERLALAQQAYQEFRFTDILTLLSPQLEPESRIPQQLYRVEARAWLGAALFQQSQLSTDARQREALIERAYTQLLELLREQPDYELDPYIFSLSVTEFLQRVREENAEELDKLRKKTPRAGEDDTSAVIYIERAVRKRSKALVFAPFALGQFQNGQEVKGTLLATGQAFGLIANLTGYGRNILVLSRLPGGRFPRQPDNNPGPELATAQTFSVIQYVGLATFAALYLYSVVDGLYFFEREELLQLRTLDGPPPELQPQHRLPAAPPLQLQWEWRF